MSSQAFRLSHCTVQGISNIYELDALQAIYNSSTVKPAVVQVCMRPSVLSRFHFRAADLET